MQIILILFLLNFSKNYYLLSDRKNFDIFIPGGGSKNFTTGASFWSKGGDSSGNYGKYFYQ